MAGWRALNASKEDLLFLKKKKQKNFWSWGVGQRPCHNPQQQKFFGSFFQKRTFLLTCLWRASGLPRRCAARNDVGAAVARWFR
jgi:hypothetical protein